MDLLDRLLGHDAWTTRQLLLLCADLHDEQLDRHFDIGPHSVRATFEHIVRNVEAWTDLMTGAPIRPGGGSSMAELLERHDRASADLERLANAVADRDGWDERWVDPLETPRKERSFGGSIAHVVTHSMHHRAQLLYMLRVLDIPGRPEGDVLSWENR